MFTVRGTKEFDDARQRCVGTGSHAQRLYGQPRAINVDHGTVYLSHSRIQALQEAALSRGHRDGTAAFMNFDPDVRHGTSRLTKRFQCRGYLLKGHKHE